jgi:hypothetical protein
MKNLSPKLLPGNYPNDFDGPTGIGLVLVYHLRKTLQGIGS